jgi:sirohydrochlorin ferrochelatase
LGDRLTGLLTLVAYLIDGRLVLFARRAGEARRRRWDQAEPLTAISFGCLGRFQALTFDAYETARASRQYSGDFGRYGPGSALVSD